MCELGATGLTVLALVAGISHRITNTENTSRIRRKPGILAWIRSRLATNDPGG
jgi:hypothetical protein